MSRLTRRRFLTYAAAGVGSLAAPLLGACRTDNAPRTLLPTTPTRAHPTSVPLPTSSATASPALTPPATRAPGLPDLAVARSGEPEALVRQAIAALGGIERFVPVDSDVIVKPNICVAYHTFEYAATTNPWVVGALVKLCREAGARRIRVMDSPFGGTPEQAYSVSGIQEQVLAAGGEMETMTAFKFVQADVPQGQDLQSLYLYDETSKANVVINVPIAKNHSLARLTLGMKNLMGVIRDREAMHQNMGQRLADLASLVRPKLTVIDAVRILMDHGPTGGDLNDVKQLDTVIASTDIVAADSYAATLFGLQPDDLAYIRAGAAMGLGHSDLSSLTIEEVSGAG